MQSVLCNLFDLIYNEMYFLTEVVVKTVDKNVVYTVKKRLGIFPSPAGMSLTKLSLAGND
jgi:hypothetical protein